MQAREITIMNRLGLHARAAAKLVSLSSKYVTSVVLVVNGRRANARHINGTAILYADQMTDSMKLAIDETDRRRAKQVAFNLANGIEPKGVSKLIKDMIDGVYSTDDARENRKAAQEEAKYDALSEKQLDQRIRKLEKEMLEAAKNLEFERAASLRDELKAMRDRLMMVGGEG